MASVSRLVKIGVVVRPDEFGNAVNRRAYNWLLKCHRLEQHARCAFSARTANEYVRRSVIDRTIVDSACQADAVADVRRKTGEFLLNLYAVTMLNE
jgi:hypothetical protein